MRMIIQRKDKFWKCFCGNKQAPLLQIKQTVVHWGKPVYHQINRVDSIDIISSEVAHWTASYMTVGPADISLAPMPEMN